LLQLKLDQLGDAKTVHERHPDHGGVTIGVTPGFRRGLVRTFDSFFGEVLSSRAPDSVELLANGPGRRSAFRLL
jgi:hypothetical protein